MAPAKPAPLVGYGLPAVRQPESPQALQPYNELAMTCDLCSDDDGEGIHYHAFIEGRHYWVCESCKDRLRVESEHTDE
jgi:hypothetical protein